MREQIFFKTEGRFDQHRFEDSGKDYKKFLELHPGFSSVEKHLFQTLQAQDALNSAYSHFDSGDYSKALEYINKIVLVYSPYCLKVLYWCI